MAETNLVKSIFKNGKSTTSTEEFTKMWIDLINKLEKRTTNPFSAESIDAKTAGAVSEETKV